MGAIGMGVTYECWEGAKMGVAWFCSTVKDDEEAMAKEAHFGVEKGQ